jgi:DnaJ-domain-containing protein 1
MIEAHPLHWPIGWKREHNPQPANFKTPLVDARNGLTRQLELLGARNIIISSNAELTRSGDIAARQRRIDDTGVAVYFTLDGQQRCIPCDKWIRLEDNVHAIELTVEALRGLSRWGAKEMVNAAFAGFEALPEGGDDPWHVTLGVSPVASIDEIEAAYRRLAKQLHPDLGGNAEDFHALERAYRRGRAERSGT